MGCACVRLSPDEKSLFSQVVPFVVAVMF